VATTTVPRLGIDDVHRFTLDEYHRLIESGGFDEDSHVELLDGLLVKMSPKTPEHERAIGWLMYWLIRALDEQRHEVGVGRPLTLERSEPEPDLFVIARDVPSPHHPATAALVIEVSVSSLSRDLAVKPKVYAAAGIPEYWVLDVEGRRLVVHTKPQADGYANRREYAENARVTATALTLPELDLGELLRAAHG
jgi:Uma2 family endonuclease